jgi:hypothetical protein
MIYEDFLYLIGLTGILVGIEIIASAIAFLSILYLKNPQITGIIWSISSLSMTSGLIVYFLKKA